jgi:serine protease AprX
MSQRTRPKISKKFTWGRTILFALIAAIALWAAPADAQGGRGSHKPAKATVSKVKKPAKVRHAKLDEALNEVADGVGDSDVIVEFYDDADGLTRIKAAGGKGGRRLGIIRGRAGRMPNALLKKLANDPKVKRIHRDRETSGDVARTSAAIGASSVSKEWGYTGAGIGVAVIDSGITPWHDDLTLGKDSGQRVTAFVDFVNGQTAKYDDWGHGTHVAGIIASNGAKSGGSKKSIAPKANIIALKALDGTGKGRISHIIAALDWAVANRVQYNIRVINMSLGAGVFESYHTDPLTLAAKRAVDVGIVVVASAGNLGMTRNGLPQYGAISAPGNAPWVLDG